MTEKQTFTLKELFQGKYKKNWDYLSGKEETPDNRKLSQEQIDAYTTPFIADLKGKLPGFEEESYQKIGELLSYALKVMKSVYGTEFIKLKGFRLADLTSRGVRASYISSMETGDSRGDRSSGYESEYIYLDTSVAEEVLRELESSNPSDNKSNTYRLFSIISHEIFHSFQEEVEFATTTSTPIMTESLWHKSRALEKKDFTETYLSRKSERSARTYEIKLFIELSKLQPPQIPELLQKSLAIERSALGSGEEVIAKLFSFLRDWSQNKEQMTRIFVREQLSNLYIPYKDFAGLEAAVDLTLKVFKLFPEEELDFSIDAISKLFTFMDINSNKEEQQETISKIRTWFYPETKMNRKEVSEVLEKITKKPAVTDDDANSIFSFTSILEENQPANIARLNNTQDVSTTEKNMLN
jgi:hypothetical protein